MRGALGPKTLGAREEMKSRVSRPRHARPPRLCFVTMYALRHFFGWQLGYVN